MLVLDAWPEILDGLRRGDQRPSAIEGELISHRLTQAGVARQHPINHLLLMCKLLNLLGWDFGVDGSRFNNRDQLGDLHGVRRNRWVLPAIGRKGQFVWRW